MYRIAQAGMVAGFIIAALLTLFYGLGFPLIYAGLILMTGGFALWGLRKRARRLGR